MAKHNKKRNVGLLYEQLIRHAASCLVEKDRPSAEKTLSILNKNFNRSSELYREFRLFNALVNTRVSCANIAKRIVAESKAACHRHDLKKLRQEKSCLIKEINHGLDKHGFYNQRLENYKIFATVQALLNQWRGRGSLAPEEVVRYENVLEEWLTRPAEKESTIEKEHANQLVYGIMLEKFEKKYDQAFSKEQKQIFESFLHSDLSKTEALIENLKERSKNIINQYFISCDNSVLLEKREIVEKNIRGLNETATAESVSKAMLVSALLNEMENTDV